MKYLDLTGVSIVSESYEVSHLFHFALFMVKVLNLCVALKHLKVNFNAGIFALKPPLFSQLRTLCVNGQITDRIFAHLIGACSSLEELELPFSSIKDSSMNIIPYKCPLLTKLAIPNSSITGAGLSFLQKLPLLTQLDLRGCSAITQKEGRSTFLKYVNLAVQLFSKDFSSKTCPLRLGSKRFNSSCTISYGDIASPSIETAFAVNVQIHHRRPIKRGQNVHSAELVAPALPSGTHRVYTMDELRSIRSGPRRRPIGMPFIPNVTLSRNAQVSWQNVHKT